MLPEPLNSPAEVLAARKHGEQLLGYTAAEVAGAHMDLHLAAQVWGQELVERMCRDALLAFMGTAEDWRP